MGADMQSGGRNMAEQDRQRAVIRESPAERPEPEERTGKECPQCGTANDQEARFCAECGFDFLGKTTCPECGAKVNPGADICEACGAWLLDDVCKFCGADVEEGQVRCGECGNPVDGIVCTKCGHLSFFDFCKTCTLPLTSAAQEMVARVKSAPLKQPSKDEAVFASKQEARRYYMAYKFCLQEGAQQTPSCGHSDEREQMLKLKTYLQQAKTRERKNIPRPLFTKGQKASIQSGGASADAEIQRQEEERRRREEEARRKREEEERQRREEERRREEEEEERRRRGGWRCNRYGVVHDDGPCGCSAPEYGGVWLDE